MSDEPDSLILRHQRKMDEKLDRLIEDVGDLKVRMPALEERVAGVELAHAGTNRRIDRMEARLDRIEKRLDLVEPQSE